MEKELKIRTPDKKIIYAKLRGSLKRPVVVIVHGLTSSILEALYYNAARYFESKGFSVLLFGLYDWRKPGRKLKDCTLKIHGRDIDTIVAYLHRKGAKRIHIIGHSYGAPSILHSRDKRFDTVTFWDGSGDLRFLLKGKYIKAIRGRVMNVGCDVVIPEKLIRESKRVDVYSLIKKVDVPIKIICAGSGVLMSEGKRMFKVAKKPKSFAIIKGATHNFDEDGVQEKLYKA